ncbi:type III pantothenate kinase [Marinobacteraceae bacterium S3BR75-40.1]
MTILQLDAGNTRIKWRVQSQQREVLAKGVNGYAPGALEKAREEGGGVFSRIELAAVAGGERYRWLKRELKQLFDAPCLEARTESARDGLKNAYARPETMGVDRWLAMLAVWSRRHRGFVVVDAGSAWTIDFVNDLGEHLGGYILPGHRLMAGALSQGTDRVDFELSDEGVCRPGKSTTECVVHGLNWLHGVALERVVFDARRAGVSEVVISGGDGRRWLPEQTAVEYWEDLVLDGLSAYMSGHGKDLGP